MVAELGFDKQIHKEAFLFAADTARGFPVEHRLSLPFITDLARLRFLDVTKVTEAYRLRDFCDWIEAEVSWGSAGLARKYELIRRKLPESQAHELAADLLAELPSMDASKHWGFSHFLFGGSIGKRTSRGYLDASGVKKDGFVDRDKWARILSTAAAKAKNDKTPHLVRQAIWFAFPIFKQAGWTQPQIEKAVEEIFPAGSAKQADSFSQAMRRLGLRTNGSRAAHEPPFLRDLAIRIMREEKKATRAPMSVFIWKPPILK